MAVSKAFISERKSSTHRTTTESKSIPGIYIYVCVLVTVKCHVSVREGVKPNTSAIVKHLFSPRKW